MRLIKNEMRLLEVFMVPVLQSISKGSVESRFTPNETAAIAVAIALASVKQFTRLEMHDFAEGDFNELP